MPPQKNLQGFISILLQKGIGQGEGAHLEDSEGFVFRFFVKINSQGGGTSPSILEESESDFSSK